MNRALELAALGLGNVAPNPMVGCVIVKNGQIIGEGYHERYGEAHAEVNAIKAVKDEAWLKDATLYVTLEPCSHYGKTPPCSDLIISKGIPEVVIATQDPFPKVNGSGIDRMKANGINVITGVMEGQAWQLNKRFFTFHQQKRPFIILKWAQSQDQLLDKTPTPHGLITKITNEAASTYVHYMRSIEQGILVGGKTIIQDDPLLTTRKVEGKSPTRIVIDTKGNLPENARVFGNDAPTVVFTPKKQAFPVHVTQVITHKDILDEVIGYAYENDIQSIMIEGGRKTLQAFIEKGLWDEAYVFTGNVTLNTGTKAPKITGEVYEEKRFGDNVMEVYFNG